MDYETLEPVLWIVGNRRSGTLRPPISVAQSTLWIVGNRRSGTLKVFVVHDRVRCGLSGIAAQVHFIRVTGGTLGAVDCRESPLRYTNGAVSHGRGACCGLSGIAAQVHSREHGSGTVRSCGLSGIAAQVHLGWNINESKARCGLSGIAAQVH